MKLYHYAVFVRARQGTVRRNVAITRRDIAEASRVASDAVSRHLKEPVVVLDAVPLRERVRGKGTTTLKPRSKRPITVKRVKYVLSRRPRARESLVLTKRGARPIQRDRELLTPHVPVTDRTREQLPKRDPGACMSERCVKRGSCGHKRNQGTELLTFESRVRVGAEGYVLVLRTLAVDRDTARRAMRKELEHLGFGHKRLSRISVNPGARPIGLGH